MYTHNITGLKLVIYVLDNFFSGAAFFVEGMQLLSFNSIAQPAEFLSISSYGNFTKAQQCVHRKHEFKVYW